MNIQSTSQTEANLDSNEHGSSEPAKLIVFRLIWTSFTVLLCWGALLATLSLVNLPQAASNETQAETSLVSCRIAAFILIVNFLSISMVNFLAPSHVLRGRLVSNTIFGGLLLAILAALTLVAQILSANTYNLFKAGVQIAYQPSFLSANLVLSALTALIIYGFRRVKLADMTEVYWGLGLMFLFGLAISLVSMIVAS